MTFGHHSLPGSCLLLLSLLVCSCGKPPTPADTGGGNAPGSASASSSPADRGVISGKVSFEGDVPPPLLLLEANKCHSGSPPVYDQTVVVNPNKTLKNVIVYVKGAPAGDGGGPPVVLDQRGCQYVPHVLALQVLQPLIIRNSDPQIHNVHLKCEVNPEQNFAMIERGDNPPITFKAPEFFEIKCDVHNWMTAEAAVFDNTCFAVTDETGAFRISGVPPGDYTLVARHERFGELSSAVTLSARGNTSCNFTFKQPTN